MIIGGGSAGGHLALRCAQRDASSVRGLLLWNAVSDTTTSGYGSDRFRSQASDYSPLHTLTRALPPLLLLHGTSDDVVPYANSVALQQRQQALGGVAELDSWRMHRMVSI